MDNKPLAHAPMPAHVDLQAIARQVMLENGFEPEFPPAVLQQLSQLQSRPPQVTPDGNIRDLRNLLWSSIDNDTSRDLDQIEVAERLPGGATRILIGIADVDAYVPKGSPIDLYAESEGATLCTGVENFSMLPEELSTNLTSLLEGVDRLCIVIEIVIGGDAALQSGQAYPALVRNRAQLAY